MEFSKRNISANALKGIAIIAMLFDHYFAVFIPDGSAASVYLRILGRVVAPIMCFLIAEGYFHTKNVRRYVGRLLLFAALSHFPYVLYFQLPWWQATSVFWGLALGLLALAAVRSAYLETWIKILIVALCCVLAVPANWNYVSVLWIVCFGVFRGRFKEQMTCMVTIGYFFNALPYVWDWEWQHFYQFAIVLAIPLLALYHGRRGARSRLIKWGFYLFYPAHLLLLFGLRHWLT